MVTVDWEKAFKPIIALSVLIISCAVGYYFAVVLPAQAQEKINLQLQEQNAQQSEAAANRADLDACLALADDTYNANWKTECNGENLGDNCRLPTYAANIINKEQSDQKDLCFREYPQK